MLDQGVEVDPTGADQLEAALVLPASAVAADPEDVQRLRHDRDDGQRRPIVGPADAGDLALYGYALSRVREAGAVTAVVYCLQRLCFGLYLAGDLVGVRSSAEEAISLGRGIGQPAMTAQPVAWLAVLAALQDRDEYDHRLVRVEALIGL